MDMSKNNNSEKPTFWGKIKAPFMVLKIEKFYLVWVASYIVAFLGIIIEWLNHNLSNSIENGMIYSTCMAVIAPLFIEFLSDYISKNRQKSKEEYSIYKGWTICACFIGLLLLFLFYVTDLKSSVVIQVISFFVVFLISFYTYLVTKMSLHKGLLVDYKDESYADKESKELKRIKGDSQRLKETTIKEGAKVKL